MAVGEDAPGHQARVFQVTYVESHVEALIDEVHRAFGDEYLHPHVGMDLLKGATDGRYESGRDAWRRGNAQESGDAGIAVFGDRRHRLPQLGGALGVSQQLRSDGGDTNLAGGSVQQANPEFL